MPAVANACAGRLLKSLPFHLDAPGRWREQAGGNTGHRRLACSIRTDQREGLGLMDGERHAEQRVERSVAGMHVVELEHDGTAVDLIDVLSRIDVLGCDLGAHCSCPR